MPIFRINDQLHYFAHVPKCGGTSIEAYLTERFGPLGFLELARHLIPPDRRWNRTSSEHIPAQELHRLIPEAWMSSCFAVVRHPVRRLISAFFFSRDVSSLTPLPADFNLWALDILPRIPNSLYLLERHLRPQSDLVPNGSRIFRLEDGLEQLVPYLDALAGNSDGPREIATTNGGRWRHVEAVPLPNEAVLELIGKVYAVDFARFGYDTPSTSAAVAVLPDLPVLASTSKPPAARRRRLATRIKRYLMQKDRAPMTTRPILSTPIFSLIGPRTEEVLS